MNFTTGQMMALVQFAHAHSQREIQSLELQVWSFEVKNVMLSVAF